MRDEHRAERVAFRDSSDVRCICCRQLWPCDVAKAQLMAFTEYFTVEAVGHRIGLMCCKECGAVVLIGDDSFDSPKAHTDWHHNLTYSKPL